MWQSPAVKRDLKGADSMYAPVLYINLKEKNTKGKEQMSDTPILGCIYMFAGNFAPRGYALCAGQLLAISQNTALFSLLGTTYGGDGITTFALPDLRGRSPISAGQGPGLTDIT